jgi:hypothetical protein
MFVGLDNCEAKFVDAHGLAAPERSKKMTRGNCDTVAISIIGAELITGAIGTFTAIRLGSKYIVASVVVISCIVVAITVIAYACLRVRYMTSK